MAIRICDVVHLVAVLYYWLKRYLMYRRLFVVFVSCHDCFERGCLKSQLTCKSSVVRTCSMNIFCAVNIKLIDFSVFHFWPSFGQNFSINDWHIVGEAAVPPMSHWYNFTDETLENKAVFYTKVCISKIELQRYISVI